MKALSTSKVLDDVAGPSTVPRRTNQEKSGEVIAEVQVRDKPCIYVLQEIEWDDGGRCIRYAYYKWDDEQERYNFVHQGHPRFKKEVARRLNAKAMAEGLFDGGDE